VLHAVGALSLAAAGLSGGAACTGSRSVDQHTVGDPELDARVQEIVRRPVFAGARWGMKFSSPDAGRTVYAMQQAELFPAGSTVKYFPTATAFATLGAGHRFRTRVHRTGPMAGSRVAGDLVVVAGGDLLMGGRIQPDGSLAMTGADHANNIPTAAPLPGDPLRTVRDIAAEVAARGVTRIDGRVLVDVSLFRGAQERIALGDLTVPITPIMINDNVIDVVAEPGRAVGEPAVLRVSPDIGYVSILNDVVTVADDAQARRPAFVDDVTNADGTHVVRLTGSVPLSRPSSFTCYYIPDPARFAEMAFSTALRDAGVEVGDARGAGSGVAAQPTPENLLTEYLSPPVSEAVKIMSNIHSKHWPYLVGAIAGGDPVNAGATGAALQRRLVEEAGLQPPAPGAEGRYSPDYYVQFLTHLTQRDFFPPFRDVLSVLGRSGSLAAVQVDSPAAGHVHAKGGHVAGGSVGCALAGYIEPPNGPRIVFSQYMEIDPASVDDVDEMWETGTEAQGEIVTAVWEHLRLT
jgi:D-alanyl-D-alanine carboxypeptidase/D-alanyl-D-alanine-endopeptidase (penicillin-binding protein 4)